MRIILIILGIILLLVVIYFIRLQIGFKKHLKRVAGKMSPVLTSLEKNETPEQELINKLAADPDTRNALYGVLESHHKQELFPKEFRTTEKFAESDLVRWLSHPNELQTCPDEIELVEKITLGSNTPYGPFIYYVFKYCTHPPHWAAKDGWIVGVSGPYFESENIPLASPPGTFSTFEKYGFKTPKDFVDQEHKMITERGTLKLWLEQIDEQTKNK